MKKVAVLGSTGSIGTQTLDVIKANKSRLKVHSLVAYSNATKLKQQAAEFSPQYSALISEEGERCLLKAVEGADVVVVATRGIVAIECILYCLEHGIDVALANKEALVCGGELVMGAAGNANLLPVDSEHCAIEQCLRAHSRNFVQKLLLTASGGPFWELSVDELESVSASRALQHPNWNMGSKITVDSATMMNKALEVVEASFLFGVPVKDIEITVHRQSIVHSMVQYKDGSVVAQLALPDMRLPIQWALLGESGGFSLNNINFTEMLTLSFEGCNYQKFPCAELGYTIMNYPPLCRTVMNAANDVCVEKFLQGKFSFSRFHSIIMNAVDHFCDIAESRKLAVETIREFDGKAREYTNRLLDGE